MSEETEKPLKEEAEEAQKKGRKFDYWKSFQTEKEAQDYVKEMRGKMPWKEFTDPTLASDGRWEIRIR